MNYLSQFESLEIEEMLVVKGGRDEDELYDHEDFQPQNDDIIE